MVAPSLQLTEGAVFGARWRVGRCIRAGGMGAVYEAAHVETEGRCALKVMLPEVADSAELRARFRQEAQVAAKITSDHIVKVFDAGTDEPSGVPYLVMELLEGEDLGGLLKGGRPLPFEQVVALLRQVAHGLGRAHAAGVVHRDLKPANLFVTTRDDGTPCVKVLDFGIAKLVARGRQRPDTTLALGTPVYMAPEQIRGDGDIGPAADLYTLAQVTFTLLAGRPYWADETSGPNATYRVMTAIVSGTREAASVRSAWALPPGFDAWFARATALEPRDRFDSAQALVAALAALDGGRHG
jgi:serine/threonine-protein kinase